MDLIWMAIKSFLITSKKDGSGCRISHLFSNNMNSLSILFIKQCRTYYRNIHSIYKRKGSSLAVRTNRHWLKIFYEKIALKA